MEVLSFSNVIEKVGIIVKKLIDTRHERRANKILHQLLVIYIRLGDVLDSNDEIETTLHHFSSELPLTFKSNCKVLENCIEREKLFLEEAQREITNLWHILNFLDHQDEFEEYWEVLRDNELDGQSWVKDAIESTVGDWHPLELREQSQVKLPVIYLSLESLREGKNVPAIAVDLNKKDFSVELNLLIEHLADPKVIGTVRTVRAKIKKLIKEYWSAEDILGAMVSLKKFS